MDANRQLVTASGARLVWSGTIPDGYTDLSVRTDGTVDATMQDGTVRTLGTVQLARFNNPTGLKENGNNNWLETVPSGAPIVAAPGTTNMGTVNTHQVEQSNVDISREMTQLMVDQRSFQMSVKAFQQTDQMIQEALSLRKA